MKQVLNLLMVVLIVLLSSCGGYKTITEHRMYLKQAISVDKSNFATFSREGRSVEITNDFEYKLAVKKHPKWISIKEIERNNKQVFILTAEENTGGLRWDNVFFKSKQKKGKKYELIFLADQEGVTHSPPFLERILSN